MSSLKNAHKSGRKPYGERTQTSERRHLGHLEKKADYRKRAADYAKKRALRIRCKKLILDKNPDEFYFGMISSQVDDSGRHVSHKTGDGTDGSAPLTDEQLALIQSQDQNYVRYALSVEQKKIDQLKANLHLIDGHVDLGDAGRNKHTFFVDDDEDLDECLNKISESRSKSSRLAANKDLSQKPLFQVLHRKKHPTNKSIALSDIEIKSIAVERKRSYDELNARLERAEQLRILVDKMEMRRNLSDKKVEKPKCIRRETPESAPIYKWKAERKK